MKPHYPNSYTGAYNPTKLNLSPSLQNPSKLGYGGTRKGQSAKGKLTTGLDITKNTLSLGGPSALYSSKEKYVPQYPNMYKRSEEEGEEGEEGEKEGDTPGFLKDLDPKLLGALMGLGGGSIMGLLFGGQNKMSSIILLSLLGTVLGYHHKGIFKKVDDLFGFSRRKEEAENKAKAEKLVSEGDDLGRFSDPPEEGRIDDEPDPTAVEELKDTIKGSPEATQLTKKYIDELKDEMLDGVLDEGAPKAPFRANALDHIEEFNEGELNQFYNQTNDRLRDIQNRIEEGGVNSLQSDDYLFLFGQDPSDPEGPLYMQDNDGHYTLPYLEDKGLINPSQAQHVRRLLGRSEEDADILNSMLMSDKDRAVETGVLATAVGASHLGNAAAGAGMNTSPGQAVSNAYSRATSRVGLGGVNNAARSIGPAVARIGRAASIPGLALYSGISNESDVNDLQGVIANREAADWVNTQFSPLMEDPNVDPSTLNMIMYGVNPQAVQQAVSQGQLTPEEGQRYTEMLPPGGLVNSIQHGTSSEYLDSARRYLDMVGGPSAEIIRDRLLGQGDRPGVMQNAMYHDQRGTFHTPTSAEHLKNVATKDLPGVFTGATQEDWSPQRIRQEEAKRMTLDANRQSWDNHSWWGKALMGATRFVPTLQVLNDKERSKVEAMRAPLRDPNNRPQAVLARQQNAQVNTAPPPPASNRPAPQTPQTRGTVMPQGVQAPDVDPATRQPHPQSQAPVKTPAPKLLQQPTYGPQVPQNQWASADM